MSTLYQYNTLGALMTGLFAGTLPLAKLLQHGDFGIGTLDGLDGEMIILDGQAYQGRSDGKVIALTGAELTPYAAVTKFVAAKSFPLENVTDAELEEKCLAELRSPNLFGAVKVHGTFSKMHVRSVPKQTPPFKRLVEVARVQPEFVAENIAGTIVGFYTPEMFHGVASSGFHLHFLADDKKFGGHILDYTLERGAVELANISTFTQELPTAESYLDADIDITGVAAEISEAE